MEGHFRKKLSEKRNSSRLKPPALTKVTYVVVEDVKGNIKFKLCSKLLFAEYSSDTLSVPELRSAILKDHIQREKAEGRHCKDKSVKLYLSDRGQEITDISDLPKLFKYTTKLYAEFKSPIAVSPESPSSVFNQKHVRVKRELDTDVCVDFEFTEPKFKAPPLKKAKSAVIEKHSEYVPRNQRIAPENLNSLIVAAGKDIPHNIPTIECYRFNIGTQLWGKMTDFSGRIDLSMDDSSVIGEGGFRKCYKAKIVTESGEKAVAIKIFSDQGKSRLRDFLSVDEGTNLDMERCIKRDIQINEAALNLATEFNHKLQSAAIKFNPCFLGRLTDADEEICFVEPLLDGVFWRAISNNGWWEI